MRKTKSLPISFPRFRCFRSKSVHVQKHSFPVGKLQRTQWKYHCIISRFSICFHRILPQSSLEEISLRRIPCFCRYRKPQAYPAQGILYVSCPDDAAPEVSSTFKNFPEVPAFPDPLQTTSIQNYGTRRLRPFLLLALSTFLPPLVAILALNPCLLFFEIPLGWYVLFIVVSCIWW